MNETTLSFKKEVVFIFLCLIIVICTNEGKIKIENPVTSEEITNEITSVPNNFSTKKLFQKEATTAFYASRDYAAAWNNKEVRASFLAQLKNADKEGLFLKDYHGEEIQHLLKNEKVLKEDDRVSLEILLTDAFFEYADNLLYGKLDPKEMYGIWGVDRKQINLVQVLQEAVEKHEIEKALGKLKPQNEIYVGLKKSLQEYRDLLKKRDSTKNIANGEAIKPGKKDERIPVVASRLKQLGLLDDNYTPKDSIYDPILQAAIKEFQTKKGLSTDMVIGNSTLQELNMGTEQRYHQLLANLERWRWYPHDLGNPYILINIPNYKLTLVKNGDTVQTHNVIAGDKTHHTPVFSDSIQYIVINPQWHIPSSIRDAEIIPSAAANPNYLSSRNIYVTDSQGKRIDPSTINWSSGEAKNYRFTQGAGPSNSLGRIKIIYPNEYAIYLHDTPAQSLFNRNLRAESHGCVRVENVVELAAYLLGNKKDWSIERIKNVIYSGQTRQVAVTIPVKVHHFYWTAWRKNGETIFINDVYKLDKAIYTALKE